MLLPSWVNLEESPTLTVKGEDLTTTVIQKLIPHFAKQNPVLLLFRSGGELFVVGPGDYEKEITPLLILRTTRKGKVLWLNNPSLYWLDVSPDKRFIAYEGPRLNPGIWVFDAEGKKAKLTVPYVLNGKLLFLPGAGFIESKQLVIERMDERLWKEVTEGPFTPLLWSKYLNKQEKKRLDELLGLYFQCKLKEDEAKELSQLLEKAEKKFTEAEKEASKKESEAEKRAFASRESFIVNLETGEEKLIMESGEVVGLSQDKQWFYVWHRPSNKVFKVKVDDPSQNEEFLPFYLQGLKIRSEEPLRFGYRYPGFVFGLFIPSSTQKCYCYGKKDDEFVLLKTLDIGDKKFPQASHISVSPKANYSLAYGEGMFLKDLKSGKIRKIEDRTPYSFTWDEEGDKLAYVVKGKKCFEIWLYDIAQGNKQRVFP